MKFSARLIKQLFGKGGTKDKEIMDFALGFYKRLVESNPYRETFDRETFYRSLDATARLLVGDETCASVAFDGTNILVATNENTHNKDQINCKINFLIKADKYAVDQYNFYPVVYLSMNNSPPTRTLIETPVTYYYHKRKDSLVLSRDSLREIDATLAPAQHLLPGLSDLPVGPIITISKEIPLATIVEASGTFPQRQLREARYEFIKEDIASFGDKGRELDGILLPVSLNSLQRRAESLVEHLSMVCVLASRSDGLDLETLTKYKQVIDTHRQRVLMHTLTWECATWFKDKLKPREYIDSGISQLNDFFNKLNEDFNGYKRANSANSGLISLIRDWFEQAKGKISNGTIEAPDYIKEKLEVFSARASRYFVDIERLTNFFSILAKKGDDPLANLLINKGRLGQDKDFIKVIDDLANGVHAEMRILYYFLINGKIPEYIATSLLCCAHCKLVMDSYKMESISGMHAKMYGNWPIPEFSDMQVFLKKVLGPTLFEKFKALENSTVTLNHEIVRRSEIALKIMENISAFYDVFDWGNETPLPRLWGDQDMLADQSDDEVLSEKNSLETNSQQGNTLKLKTAKNETAGKKVDGNFTGKGMTIYKKTSYWNEYSKVAMGEILKLRLESLEINLNQARIIHPKNNLNGKNALTFVKDLVTEIRTLGLEASNGAAIKPIVLIPVNINNEHWVGMTIEFADRKIKVTYMDSEGNPIPRSLKESLGAELARTYSGMSIAITEKAVEKQTSNNCGPMTVENLIKAVGGAIERIGEDNAVERIEPVKVVEDHSLLYEQYLIESFLEERHAKKHVDVQSAKEMNTGLQQEHKPMSLEQPNPSKEFTETMEEAWVPAEKKEVTGLNTSEPEEVSFKKKELVTMNTAWKVPQEQPTKANTTETMQKFPLQTKQQSMVQQQPSSVEQELTPPRYEAEKILKERMKEEQQNADASQPQQYLAKMPTFSSHEIVSGIYLLIKLLTGETLSCGPMPYGISIPENLKDLVFNPADNGARANRISKDDFQKAVEKEFKTLSDSVPDLLSLGLTPPTLPANLPLLNGHKEMMLMGESTSECWGQQFKHES